MTALNIKEKKAVSMAELKEELTNIKKRDGELSFRGQKTDEYINEFNLIKPKQAEDLYEKILSLNVPRLKDNQINKIVDMLPHNIADLKVIIQGYSIPITNENLKKIVDAVADFLPAKK